MRISPIGGLQLLCGGDPFAPEAGITQSAVRLSTPASLRRGDTVTVTCTHDPGLHALLPELARTPPRYVVRGEGTTEEICLGIRILILTA